MYINATQRSATTFCRSSERTLRVPNSNLTGTSPEDCIINVAALFVYYDVLYRIRSRIKSIDQEPLLLVTVRRTVNKIESSVLCR